MKRGAAAAKLNLALVVGPRRPDGMHEVATVYQRIALADRVEVRVAERTEVTGYLITGGGHAWPGGTPLGSTDEFGITSRQFDASELIWTFLSRHL